MIHLGFYDWLSLAIFLIVTIILTFYFSQKKQSLATYFKADGKLPWFIAGTAMVATTFGADTPLAITEIIAKDGIAGNWAWWYMSIGAVSTVFIFAPLWRRAEVLTDLEFLELRYSGFGARLLRGIKAVYLGALMNLMILSWVNLAMLSILESIFDHQTAVYILIFLLFFCLVYTSFLGVGGISYIDVFQFFFAMGGCILLAYSSLQMPEIGGLAGLKEKLPANAFSFYPSRESIPSFLVLIFFLWWMSWYPGSEPGGGGYIAQRIVSAKDEISATKSTLWFLFAHYFVRPWPWIIVALCSLVMYPNLAEDKKGSGFILMIEPALTSGGKGLLISTFIAAYLSTIATHLNWGASYLVNDLTKPFLLKNKGDKFYLKYSYLVQIVSAILSIYVCIFWIKKVSSVWFFMIEASSGIGFALIFRWFWWRISAWSELSGFLVSPIFFAFIKLFTNLVFPYSALATGLLTIVFVILITYLSPGTSEHVLLKFYHRIKPAGFGWKYWAEQRKLSIYKSNIQSVLISCISSLIAVFTGLFSVGSLFFGTSNQFTIFIGIFIISIGFMFHQLKKMNSII